MKTSMAAIAFVAWTLVASADVVVPDDEARTQQSSTAETASGTAARSIRWLVPVGVVMVVALAARRRRRRLEP